MISFCHIIYSKDQLRKVPAIAANSPESDHFQPIRILQPLGQPIGNLQSPGQYNHV